MPTRGDCRSASHRAGRLSIVRRVMVEMSSLAESVSVLVWYDGDPGWLPSVTPKEATVTGRSDEAFVHALARTFGPPPEGNRYNLVVRDGAETVDWLGEITEQVSLGDAAMVANGQTLQVDVLGRGGGAIPLMLDIVNAVLTVDGLLAGGAKVKRAIEAGRWKSQRQAARDWVDEGTDTEPSMELRRFVFEQPSWERGEFDRAFDLDRASGSALLRALGFRKTGTKPETWVEPNPDSWADAPLS